MKIHTPDLWGRTKHQMAIDRIREFCAGKRVLVAFSGGKDSQCCYHLAEEAGITFTAQYSITRFEPPELLAFIRKHYPDVKFRRAYTRSLIEDIEAKGVPTRWCRWCCGAKHAKTAGFDIAIVGVRWEESPARRETWRMFGMDANKMAYLCPVIDWTEAEVWEYLGDRPHCSLYDEGHRRIGCVMCPLVPGKMLMESRRWPKTAAVLRKGADRFVERMRQRGFVTMKGKACPDWCGAASPEDEHWARWLHTGQTLRPVTAVDDSPDECLFAGTGFSGSDEGGEEDE